MIDDSTDKEPRPRIGDELIWGARGIAEEIKDPGQKTEDAIHRARYLVRTKRVRVSRPPGGRGYFTTKQEIRRTFKLPGHTA
jgi:hypothetical protein